MTQFQKGREKTGGKQKGYQSPIKKAQQEILAMVVNKEFTPERISELLGQLAPKEKLQFYVQILPFIAPRLQAANISVDTSEKNEPLNNLLSRLANDEKK